MVDYGFSFWVAFTDACGNPLTLDPTFFNLTIVPNTVVYEDGYYKIKASANLGAKACDLSDFSGISSKYLSKGLGKALYCLINKRYKLAGNYLSNNYQFVAILFIQKTNTKFYMC